VTKQRGESYRLFTRVIYSFGAHKGEVVNPKLLATTIDNGVEFPYFFLGTINLKGPKLTKNSDGTYSVAWLGYGKPDSGPELSLQAVAARQSVNIWHLLQLKVTSTPSGIVGAVDLRGSEFPSHRVWLNGSRVRRC
jgi:hypothetical protein